jgi:hypothetical protein
LPPVCYHYFYMQQAVFPTIYPSPLHPRGLRNLMAIAFSPRCFATKKKFIGKLFKRDQFLMLSG